jgi:hypothetical protein
MSESSEWLDRLAHEFANVVHGATDAYDETMRRSVLMFTTEGFLTVVPYGDECIACRDTRTLPLRHPAWRPGNTTHRDVLTAPCPICQVDLWPTFWKSHDLNPLDYTLDIGTILIRLTTGQHLPLALHPCDCLCRGTRFLPEWNPGIKDADDWLFMAEFRRIVHAPCPRCRPDARLAFMRQEQWS